MHEKIYRYLRESGPESSRSIAARFLRMSGLETDRAHRLVRGVLADASDIVELPERSQREGTVALDVRRQSEYGDGHVTGAVNIPHTALSGRSGELPRDRQLLLYCRTGSRSAVASAFLARRGYDVVYVNGKLEAALRALKQA